MTRAAIDNLEDLVPAVRMLCTEKPEECEQMAGFLELLPSIDVPLIITHRDKPDFSMETKDHKIGIEVTWSIDEGWEQAEAYLGSTHCCPRQAELAIRLLIPLGLRP